MQRTFSVALGVLWLGFAIVNLGRSDPPKVERVEVPVTKIVQAPTPDPVEVEVLPDACLAALDQTYRLHEAAGGLYAASDLQLDVISDARKTLAEGGDLNAVENEQRDLQGDMIGDLLDMETAYDSYLRYYDDCKEALK